MYIYRTEYGTRTGTGSVLSTGNCIYEYRTCTGYVVTFDYSDSRRLATVGLIVTVGFRRAGRGWGILTV